MHSGAQVSGVSLGNASDQVGSPSESQRGRKAADDRDDLPFQPERLQGFIDRPFFETPPRDEVSGLADVCAGVPNMAAQPAMRWIGIQPWVPEQ